MRKSKKRTEIAWTVFTFQGMRNEPGKDSARERQVIITTKIKQLRGSLMN